MPSPVMKRPRASLGICSAAPVLSRMICESTLSALPQTRKSMLLRIWPGMMVASSLCVARIRWIDSFSHKRTACFEIVLLCVHNNLCTARMRLYRLIQMAAVWKNRTREFHSVPKVTQTFAFFICWPNRRRC